MGINKLKFFFDLIGDIFSFISFLIISEIIELNFCNLNYYTRQNIMKRIPTEPHRCIPYDEDENNSFEYILDEDSKSKLNLNHLIL